MTQALGACGRQALRRAAVGMAPTWCSLKRHRKKEAAAQAQGCGCAEQGHTCIWGTHCALSVTEAFAGGAAY